VTIILLLLFIVVGMLLHKGTSDNTIEEGVSADVKYNWDIRQNPAWINFKRNQLIGEYDAPTIEENSEYCFDMCNNNKSCNAYLYNTKSTKCKLLNVDVPKGEWPTFRTKVSPNGVWGGGVRVQ